MDYLKKKMKKLKRRLSTKKSSLESKGILFSPLSNFKVSNASIKHRLTPALISPDQKLEGGKVLIIEKNNRKSQELNNIVFQIMGKESSIAALYGRPIQNDLAVHFEEMATTGLSFGQRKDLLSAYLTPVNCKLIAPPRLNPELKPAISDRIQAQDTVSYNKQKEISAAIACLGEALTRLLSNDKRDPTVQRLLLDTGKILCDAQYNESMIRRNNILPVLNEHYRKRLSTTVIDTVLFGKKSRTETLKENTKLSDNTKIKIATAHSSVSNSRPKSPDKSLKKAVHNNLRRSKNDPTKGYIVVPLENECSGSSKQFHGSDSRQHRPSQKGSRASTSSSPYRR